MRAVPKQGGGQRYERMHRVIMNPPEGMYVDHINNNKLDNRKSNLRLCTHMQNRHNSVANINNTSGYKGVFWHNQAKKWRVQITTRGKTHSFGLYHDKHEAAKAYNEAAKDLYGEFAYLNEVKVAITN